MNITLAPHLPIIANGHNGDLRFDNLSLLNLPTWVTIYVTEKWDEFLANCSEIANDYELFSSLLELNVIYFPHVVRAKYLKLSPDILDNCNAQDRSSALQQLYAIYNCRDAKRIYAGIADSVTPFIISLDKKSVPIINFDPSGSMTLKDVIDSYAPKLCQLKHDHLKRNDGDREISRFSAYDKHDEEYARHLLKKAFEEFPGDIDDKTFLYTYDLKFRTFVEFRPMRNNEYHGMDISKEAVLDKCPYIVSLYHK